MQPVSAEKGEGSFEAFVSSRQGRLLRLGWLLTGDWAHAEDLVQSSLSRVWPRWPGLDPAGADAYVRQVMVNQSTSWWRRRWHAEVPTMHLPDEAAGDVWAEADLSLALRAALAKLTLRQRTTVVLRYFEDLTETQTADAMHCSAGTVKSQASKALAVLRADPRLAGLIEPGRVS